MNDHLKPLFEPIRVGRKTAPNKIVAQAMEINSAMPGGKMSKTIMDRYMQLAIGRWGMTFVEAISVVPESLARKNGLVMSRENLDGFKRLVEMFKSEDPSGLLIFQITHSGRCSGPFSKVIKAYEDDLKGVPVATEKELDRIKDKFIEAALLAREAGADGIDIKACHGYLGSELLRPANNRPDKYGGSLENRARLLVETLTEARKQLPDFVIGTRFSLYEGIQGGCGTIGPKETGEDISEMLKIIAMTTKAGADYINVSAGIPSQTPAITRPVKKLDAGLYNHFRYTEMVKKNNPGKIVIGSAYSSAIDRSIELSIENLAAGKADMIGFGRLNLSEPLLPKKLAESDSSIRWCKLCSGCSRLLKDQENVRCVLYNKAAKE